MSHRIFEINKEASVVMFSTEVRVYLKETEVTGFNGDVKVNVTIESVEEVPMYIEVPQNWLVKTGIHGVTRIQGYCIALDWEVRPCALGTGLYTSVLMHVVAAERKKGVLAISKAKSQTDLIYLVKDPHKDNIPLISKLVRNGKLFKEFQRLLGTEQLLHKGEKKFIGLIVDMDQYYKDHGIEIKDAADGKLIGKAAAALAFGGGIEEMYSYGIRIIDHPNILTCKGNLNFNNGEFNNIVKWAGLNPLDYDIIIPISSVKVGDVKHLDVFDVTDHIRFISYKTERTQSYARLSTVACVTHAQYGSVFSHIVEQSNVDKITSLLSRVIEGDLDSYVKLLGNGSGNDLLGAALYAAFPIWQGKEWSLIRTNEIVNTLYSQVASGHKHVRKIKVKGGMNRRASNNIDIEKANEGNFTGAYIVDIRKGVIYIPQKLWVELGLGDFDGDDVVIYPVNVGKDKKTQIYLIGRNPMSGNTVFIGIQKGKGTVQDVPEWAEPIIKMHKKVNIPSAPEKVKDQVPEDFRSQVNLYISTLFNAALNGPGLGMVTNRIYKTRIGQLVDKKYPTAQEIVADAHTLENKVVKAIKSTLEVELTPQYFENKYNFKFGNSLADKRYLGILQFVGDLLEAENNVRYDGIYENPKLAGDALVVWDLCSKYNYSKSYRAYMEMIVESKGLVADKYKRFIPICMATKGYDPSEWISPVSKDVLKAKYVCKHLLGDKKKYGIVPCNTDLVDKVNRAYTIFTSKKNPDGGYITYIQNYLWKRMQEIVKDGIKGADLVHYKTMTAKALLAMFMNVKFSLTFDQIINHHKNNGSIVAGVRDIQDTTIRTFAYACIHAYIKGYIKSKFSDRAARVAAMLSTGSKLFGIDQNGKVRSNRLFWLYAGTFTTEEIMAISNLWCTAQNDMAKEVLSAPVNVETLTRVIDTGVVKQESIDTGCALDSMTDYDLDGFDVDFDIEDLDGFVPIGCADDIEFIV